MQSTVHCQRLRSTALVSRFLSQFLDFKIFSGKIFHEFFLGRNLKVLFFPDKYLSMRHNHSTKGPLSMTWPLPMTWPLSNTWPLSITWPLSNTWPFSNTWPLSNTWSLPNTWPLCNTWPLYMTWPLSNTWPLPWPDVSVVSWSWSLLQLTCFVRRRDAGWKNIAVMPWSWSWSCHDDDMAVMFPGLVVMIHGKIMVWLPCFPWFIPWSWYDHVFHVFLKKNGAFESDFLKIVAGIYHWMANLTGFREIYDSKLPRQQD